MAATEACTSVGLFARGAVLPVTSVESEAEPSLHFRLNCVLAKIHFLGGDWLLFIRSLSNLASQQVIGKWLSRMEDEPGAYFKIVVDTGRKVVHRTRVRVLGLHGRHCWEAAAQC